MAKTKGSKSVVGVPLSELTRVLKDEAIIPVSIKFARALLVQNGVKFSALAEPAEDEDGDEKEGAQIMVSDQ